MIYIVIPVFNRWELTQACLRSFKNQKFKDFRIIVVDHGSTDGTFQCLKELFPEVIVLKGDDSMWWTAATNLGVRKALEISASDEDSILILNNDLEIDAIYLEEILIIFNNNRPCVVGSTTVDINDKERIDFVGLKWNRFLAKYKMNREKKEKLSLVQSCKLSVKSDLLPGRGTLYPIGVFRKIGLFDEQNFPHYAADEDYSFLCKKNGYKLIVSTKAVVMSHIKETGTNFNHKKMTINEFINTLSSIKSANNLKIRLKWAKKNAPIPYLYFTIDFIRILGSYIKSRFKTN